MIVRAGSFTVATVFSGVALVLATLPVSAQDDVELLGRVHGTTPPPGYYLRKAIDPSAFTFGRAWMGRNPSLRQTSAGRVTGEPPRYRMMAPGEREAPSAALRAPGGAPAVEGTFHFPLILGYFADAELPAYTPQDVQREFFDGPNSRYKTIEELYAEISGGRVSLQGETFPWRRSSLTRSQVVGSSTGLGSDARVGEFIVEILAALDDGSVDWGLYDNDGPDGVANSGDDDGFVDILAVMHPDWGAECGGSGQSSRIWSHKWRLGPMGAMGQSFVTRTPRAGGGFIRVDDYAIQPVQTCLGGGINEIGVLAHELGHGFGLPDLYATGSSAQHSGIGEWGLMGSGAWGCRGNAPERPCHMSAWAKATLGWAQVVTLAPGEDHGELTLEPVEGGGAVYRMDVADGSGEYFLLENRQQFGFDQDLRAPGLLVWQIDPVWIEDHFETNSVNSTASHLGVWLRQADGRNDLARAGGGRGDAGDPFPGSSGNRDFHVASNPSALTHAGAASGLTLTGIGLQGTDVSARVLTRFQTISVSLAGSATGSALLVDGVGVPTSGYSFSSAPFQRHVLVPQGGEQTSDGVRIGFEWEDDPEAPRERVWVTGLEDATLVAAFGGTETRLTVDVVGEAFGVSPGVVGLMPTNSPEADGWWFPEGTVVGLLAEPNTGFEFGAWSGDAQGQPNPATVVMDGPRDVGATFDLTYGIEGGATLTMIAGSAQSVQLAAANGVGPIQWSLAAGALPQGVTFRTDGLLSGAPVVEGSFPLLVLARDTRGLEATAALVLEVVAPAFTIDALLAPLLARPTSLTPFQREYLDTGGNRNGTYDLGDFRAFFLSHPGLPGAAAAQATEPLSREVRVVRFRDGGVP